MTDQRVGVCYRLMTKTICKNGKSVRVHEACMSLVCAVCCGYCIVVYRNGLLTIAIYFNIFCCLTVNIREVL